jgi:hypothetical protein
MSDGRVVSKSVQQQARRSLACVFICAKARRAGSVALGALIERGKPISIEPDFDRLMNRAHIHTRTGTGASASGGQAHKGQGQTVWAAYHWLAGINMSATKMSTYQGKCI